MVQKVLIAWHEDRVLTFTPHFVPDAKKGSVDPNAGEQIILTPGNNSLDKKDWEKFSQRKVGKEIKINPVVQRMMTNPRGIAKLVVRDAPEPKEEVTGRSPETAGMSDGEARDWIVGCLNVKLLKRMKDEETRPLLSNAIVKQIEDIKNQTVGEEENAA